MKIRVYYEDTDLGGVVYHSNYLNFCERARSEAFFKKELSPITKNGHFVVKKIEADYIKSSTLGDILTIKNKLMSMKNTSFTLEQTIYKEETKIFSVKITLVYLNFNNRPQRLKTTTQGLIKSLFEEEV